ncbi:hypothetical protein Ancab_021099 [Ancistrocladus abbreviatus]
MVSGAAIELLRFLGIPECVLDEGGGNLQPIKEQAHLFKANKVDEIRGPSEMKRKEAQDTPKGEWENSRPNTGDMQNKKCNKKKQGQPRKKKSIKPSLLAVRRKRKKETEEAKANTLSRDKTTAEESSEDI